MKNLIVLLLVVAGGVLNAQNPTLVFAEEMPQFPGGDPAFKKYLDSAIVYPDSARKYGREGTVYVYFEVDKEGNCGNFTVKRGVPGAPELSAEALRVLQMMPKWSVGKMNGKPIKVSQTVPVKFQLPKIVSNDSTAVSLQQPQIADTLAPQFPGGESNRSLFLATKIRYPREAKEKGHQGTVYVGFTVDTTGQVADVRVVKGVPGAPELDAEAVRIVKSFPVHEPSRVNGKPIPSTVTVPVRFVLQY